MIFVRESEIRLFEPTVLDRRGSRGREGVYERAETSSRLLGVISLRFRLMYPAPIMPGD